MSTQLNNTPVGFDEDTDVRVDLYNRYGNLVFESLEEFCDRMAVQYGNNWIKILNR